MENKEKVLSVKDLKVNFSTDHGYVQAVRGVSFDLYKGETLCIVGESGSGKSVTSKTIMGILASNGRIVNGSIMYQGEDLTKVSEDEFHRIRGHKIGMIFQDPLSSLNPIVRIGKQITEAMLINSSRTKRLYEEKIAPELVAYKNAETELRTGQNKHKELIKFYKSEKKKEVEKTKNFASNEKQSRLYTLKQNFGADIFAVKSNPNLSSKERDEKIKDLTTKYREDVKNAKQFASDLAVDTKKNVRVVKADFDQKIAEASLAKKGESKTLKEQYAPILKEKKQAYKDRCKSAKKEVQQYKVDLKKQCKADVKAIKASDSKNKKAEIKERERAYVSSLKITKSEAKARALKIMSEVGISNPEKRFRQYPFEFSGGMRQRIVIAIALTADPDILICDEPTTALDVTIQAQILELINRLKRERNLSCIFITHDLGVVANMADRVAVMYAGKIVEYGTEAEIFYDPRHPYTWALLSSIPDIDSKERLEAIPGTPPNMIYPPVGDAFALRSKYAMAIDFKKEPPLFKVSPTHYAATWLLDPRAPKVEMPKIVKTRIENSLKAAKAKGLEIDFKGSDVALPVDEEEILETPVVEEAIPDVEVAPEVGLDLAPEEVVTVEVVEEEVEMVDLPFFKKAPKKEQKVEKPFVLTEHYYTQTEKDIPIFKKEEEPEEVLVEPGTKMYVEVYKTLVGEYRIFYNGQFMKACRSEDSVRNYLIEYAYKNNVEISYEMKGALR